MKIYKKEVDLIADFRKRIRNSLLRIEHRAGGTAGMPDAFLMLPWKGSAVYFPVEFKMRENDRNGFLWKVKLRPSQHSFGRLLLGWYAPHYIVVGTSGQGWDGVGWALFENIYPQGAKSAPAKEVVLSRMDAFQDSMRQHLRRFD